MVCEMNTYDIYNSSHEILYEALYEVSEDYDNKMMIIK